MGLLPPWYMAAFACLVAFVAKQKDAQDETIFEYPEVTLNDTYDFIIIGGGSAGKKSVINYIMPRSTMEVRFLSNSQELTCQTKR